MGEVGTRFLGRTGVRTSRLAFGTMTFGGGADADTSKALFRRCLDAGINHFDTADVYNRGQSETILGGLAAGLRDELLIATKAYFPSGKGVNARGSSRRHLLASVEASLRRLRTDRVDLFYLHRFDDVTALDETLRGVEQLVAQGKVLYPAVSNFAAWQVQQALGVQQLQGWAPLVAVQPMYNLVKRQAEVEILPMAMANGLAVFPYSPLGGGLLSGKFTRDVQPADARVTTWEIYRHRYGTPFAYGVAEQFNAIAAEVGVAPATLAVAWVASHDGVTAPILGARSVEQLEPALAALDVPMDNALRALISSLVPDPPPATDRNEEGVVQSLGTR